MGVIILVIVLLLVIGLAGYYYYKKNQDPEFEFDLFNMKSFTRPSEEPKTVQVENPGNQENVDCKLDEENPYSYGLCLDKTTKEPLTSVAGNCGKGIRTKTPNVVTGSKGKDSSCPSVEYEDCETPCPKQCEAPDELWVPEDGAVCMAGTRKLGVGIDNGRTTTTYCGEGLQSKILDESKITDEMLGSMSLEKYKKSINWSKCASSSLKPCKVKCTDDTEPAACPIVNYDIGWLYQGGGTASTAPIYTKESVDNLFKGNITANKLEKIDSVTRKFAQENGILKDDGTVDHEKMPKGYRIKFKASSEYSTEWLRENGCTIFIKEETEAPMTSEDATYNEVEGVCYDVGCGQFKVKNVNYTLDQPAWGGGSPSIPNSTTRNCSTRTASCCDQQFVGQWNAVPGYDGCTTDGKRRYTRTGNGTLCSDSNEKTEPDDTCNIDCELTGITLGYAKKSSNWAIGVSGTTTWREITGQTIGKTSKGTGKACGNVVNQKVSNTSALTKVLKNNFNSISYDIPDFKCGQNYSYFGQQSTAQGYSCPNVGNGFPYPGGPIKE